MVQRNDNRIKLCLSILLALYVACSSSARANPKAPELQQSAGTVVSFAPSNTELLYSLGAQDHLIGVCTYCDYPLEAKKQEKVGTFISANLERLARLKPKTVLVVDGQEALSNMLTRNGFHVVKLSNNSLNDIGSNMRTLGALTAHEAQSKELSSAFEQSLGQFNRILAQAKSKPRVFYCTWPDPLLTVGHNSFLNDVITTCSGVNIASNLPTAYPHYSTERLVLSDPDIIILPYEAHGLSFLNRQPWTSLRAVREKRVFYLPAPSEDGLSRPTTRIIKGMLWLAERLHPELSPQLKDWFDQARQPISSQSPLKQAEQSKRLVR